MTHDNTTNDHRFEDLLAKAKDLGTLAAKGADTIVQFGLTVVEAAYDGVLDLSKDKHGTGIDDAVRAYSEYDRARAGANIFNHKSPSGKVQAAKLRTCIKLGGWTRGGPGQPMGAVYKLMGVRTNLMKNPLEAKKLDDAYSTLLNFARFQLKQTTAVEDEQTLRHFCFKPVSSRMTIEDYLNGVVKKLDDLRTGKADGGNLQHSSTAVQNAARALKMEISDLRARTRTTP